MKIDAKNQRKPEKRKLTDADEESGEEEAGTVAAEKTARKKPKKGDKDQSGSHVADEDSSDTLIAAYSRLRLKGRKGKPDKRKTNLSDTDEKSGEKGAVTVAAEKTARKKPKKGDKDQSGSHVADEDSSDTLIAAYSRLRLKSRRGKPDKRKTNLSDTDEKSGEDGAVTVAAEKTARKKPKKGDKNQSGSNVADEDSSDTLIAAYSRLRLKGRRGEQENRKRKLSDLDEESGEEEAASVAAEKTARKKPKKGDKGQSEAHIAGEDSDEDEEMKASTKQSNSGSLPSASTNDDWKDKRDRRTLRLNNLPGNWDIRQIKALSNDMMYVRLRSTFTRIDDKKKRISYAYVSFDSEEAAEKNFKLLEGKLFNGTTVSVDYVGSKSQFLTRPKTEPAKIDPLRLHLKSLPGNATEGDIQMLFPEAVEIELPKRKKDKLLLGYAFVRFNDPTLTSKYHDLGQDLVLHGNKLVVFYAKPKKTTKQTQKEKIDPLRLHLKSLPGNATEGDIQMLFPEAVEIELPKRKKDKLLLGYAFVRFNDPTLTSKYHDLGQDLVLHSNKLDVFYAKQKKTTKQTQKANIDPLRLYLRSLPGNATKADIKTLFPEAVKIGLAKRKKDKLLFRYGLVRFNDPALTSKYHDQGQDMVLHGNKLVVLYAKQSKREEKKKHAKQRKRGQKKWKPTQNEYSCTLIVKNLPEDATVNSLSAIFNTASYVRIPTRDGVHKGFMFVKFSDKESLQAAMSEKQGAKLNGSELFLDNAVKCRQNNSGMRGKTKVLLVKNLSYDTDESSLMAAFDGAVSAIIPTYRNSGKAKGFAFVYFSSAEVAADVFDSMNGKSVDGRQVILEFSASNGRRCIRGFDRGRGGVVLDDVVAGVDAEVVMAEEAVASTKLNIARGESTVSGKEDHY